MRSPTVSIVLPFLDGNAFIEESVASVVRQTYDDWELLLVDDGSSDGSSAIATELAAAEPRRIRYLEHPGHANRGTTVSRNLALRSARGRYIALLDVDDVWLSGKLEEQVALLEQHPDAAMVFGTPLYWRSWSGHSGDAGADEVRGIWTAPDTVVPPPRMLAVSYPLGPGGAPCPSDLLMRREAVERVGGFEEAFVGPLQLFEDQAFLAKMYLTAPVFVTERCWTYYRLHSQSCVARVHRDGEYLRVRRFYLRWLRTYLRQQKVADREIDGLVRRASRQHRFSLRHWLRGRVHRARRRLRGGEPR